MPIWAIAQKKTGRALDCPKGVGLDVVYIPLEYLRYLFFVVTYEGILANGRISYNSKGKRINAYLQKLPARYIIYIC